MKKQIKKKKAKATKKASTRASGRVLIGFTVSKKGKTVLERRAKKMGESLSGYIRAALSV